MPNIIDHIIWRGDIPFCMRGFNALDNLVFSMLSYLQFDRIVPEHFKKPYITLEDAWREMEKRFYNDPYYFNYPVGLTAYQHDFIRAAAQAPRYKHTRIAGYVNMCDAERELQFSALTFFPADTDAYIAFRGTDSSLIGWKEDFNMTLEKVIPAQSEALLYVENAASFLNKNFYIGGHSKGGNLAVYAASCCAPKIQKRITKVFSNDGPGFMASFLQTGGYRAVRDRIESYLPQGSFFGLLFEQDYNRRIVESTAAGINQHIAYTWQVKPDDFVYADALSDKAIKLNNIIMRWIYTMEITQRTQFIETLYNTITGAQVTSLPDLIENKLQRATQIFQSFIKIDAESKRALAQALADFISAVKKSGMEARRDTLQKQTTN